MNRSHHVAVAALVGLARCAALFVLLLPGCDPPPRPPLGRPEPAATADRNAPEAVQLPEESIAAAPPWAELSDPWESWQSYFIGRNHVGFNQLQVKPAEDASTDEVQVRMTDQLSLRRGPATVLQRFELTSIETRQGDLVSFEGRLQVGPAVTHYNGQVDSGNLTITTTRGTRQSTNTVSWRPGSLGPAGLQQSLRDAPMTKGDARRLRTLMPIRFVPATVDLRAGHTAALTLSDGRVIEALEIDVTLDTGDGTRLETVIWTDEQGRVLKTYTPGLQLIAIDTTEPSATEGIVASEDILNATSIPVEGQIDDPQQASTTLFEVKPRGKSDAASPSWLPAPQPGQWTRPSDEGRLQILVARKPAPEAIAGFESAALEPERGDRRPGPLVDSGAALVKRLADTAPDRQQDQMRLALDLAQSVQSLIRRVDYTQGLVPASEVARDGVGDCTAHAVLLAALLRARGIPSRVAVGLVYVADPSQPRMVYHMWTLAHIDGQWVQLDATAPGGRAPADRIILTTDSLAGGNEYEAVSTVLGALGRFEVRVLSAEAEAD